MKYDLEKMIPHRPPMILLDSVVVADKEKVEALVGIHETSLGFSDGKVPAWFGVEYMAQAIAVFNGALGSSGGKPEIGFLVGVRNYSSSEPYFFWGEELKIIVKPNFILDNSGTFDGEIWIDGKRVAEALISTYKPDAETLKKIGSAE